MPWSAEQIDRSLDLFVTPDGRTVDGTVVLSQLDGRQLRDLVLEGLIEMADDGEWALTEKGRNISRLLTEYADPRHPWKSLIWEAPPPRDPLVSVTTP